MTTDINNGLGDPDDRQSLCHLLWYADVLDISAIIPGRFSENAIDACEQVFDLYEKDYSNPATRFKELGFPEANHYRESLLIQTRAEAIARIIEEAKSDDPRPVWILVWGNMNLIGDVLRTAPEITGSIRLFTIGTYLRSKSDGGDGEIVNWNGPGRQKIFDTFPKLWWVESDWTYGGMFPGKESVQIKNDLARYGGELGTHISDVIATVKWADNFRAGDTPSVLYVIDPENDLDDPTQSSWAGRYTKPFPSERPNYWIGVDGGVEWDYRNPQNTWFNASVVKQARMKTLLDRRADMYEALLTKVKFLYGNDQ